MAESSYQITPEKATSECVPGMMIVPYISALENCKTNYDKLEKKIEEYQKQQGVQIDELSKEVKSLNEQKSQLKQEMEDIIMQLEMKVRTITTENIPSLESELSSLRRAIESFSKSKDNEKDILSRLVALEEKITDKGKIKELEGQIEKLKGQIENQIENLKGQNEGQIKNLKGQIDNLKGQIENLKGQNEKLEERIKILEKEVPSHKITEFETPQATGEDKTNKSWMPWKKKGRSDKAGVKRTESVQNKPTAIKDESTRSKRASSSDDVPDRESSTKSKSRSREALDQL